MRSCNLSEAAQIPFARYKILHIMWFTVFKHIEGNLTPWLKNDVICLICSAGLYAWHKRNGIRHPRRSWPFSGITNFLNVLPSAMISSIIIAIPALYRSSNRFWRVKVLLYSVIVPSSAKRSLFPYLFL